jgi:hypothetical protein
MAKNLNQLTTDELGQLFPIIIVDYNPDWPRLASIESRNIIKAVGKEFISRIEHIVQLYQDFALNQQLTSYLKYWILQIVIS